MLLFSEDFCLNRNFKVLSLLCMAMRTVADDTLCCMSVLSFSSAESSQGQRPEPCTVLTHKAFSKCLVMMIGCIPEWA